MTTAMMSRPMMRAAGRVSMLTDLRRRREDRRQLEETGDAGVPVGIDRLLADQDGLKAKGTGSIEVADGVLDHQAVLRSGAADELKGALEGFWLGFAEG